MVMKCLSLIECALYAKFSIILDLLQDPKNVNDILFGRLIFSVTRIKLSSIEWNFGPQIEKTSNGELSIFRPNRKAVWATQSMYSFSHKHIYLHTYIYQE